MAAGFETYQANGKVTFSSENRLCRFLKTISIGTSAGSASVPGLSTGLAFVIATPIMNSSSSSFYFLSAPSFGFDYQNEVISWSASSNNEGHTLTIGVY